MRRAVLAVLPFALALPAAALDHSVTSSGTWRASDSPHRVLGSVTVPSGEQLVIEPGCTVVFDAASRLAVDGTLVAEGTAGAPIAFASMGPGSPGEWKGIVLNGAGPHRMAHADVASATTAVQVGQGVTVLMSSVTVSSSSGDAVAFSADALGALVDCGFADNGGAGVAMRDSSPTLTDCTFTNNARAAWVSGSSFPRASGLRAQGNAEGDGIVLDARLPVTGYGTWTNAGIPWIVKDATTLTIDTLADVGLAPGAIVKLGQGAKLLVDGSLTSAGTASSPCRVTSLRDDMAGGDTNGDGSATTPGKGDWDSIEVSATGNLRLQSAVVRHADDGVRALGGDVTLWDCDIRDAAARGAVFGQNALGYVFGTSFTDCDTGLLVTRAGGVTAGLPGGGSGSAGANSFACNATYDVQNLDDATLLLNGAWFGFDGPDPWRLAGPIDTGLVLVSEPARLELRRELSVSRPLPLAVGFRWETVSSCSSYRLSVAKTPNGSFATVAVLTQDAMTVPSWSLPDEPVLYFTVDVADVPPTEGAP